MSEAQHDTVSPIVSSLIIGIDEQLVKYSEQNNALKAAGIPGNGDINTLSNIFMPVLIQVDDGDLSEDEAQQVIDSYNTKTGGQITLESLREIQSSTKK